MPVRPFRSLNGCWVFCLIGTLAFSVSAGDSIMDIINVEKVERLLAERRENATRDEMERRLLLHNSIDGEESFFDEDDEGGTDYDPAEGESRPSRNRHKFGRGRKNLRHNLTGVPDFFAVLADLTGSKIEKVLKSDNNPILVTKKEYLKKDWCKTEPMVMKIREDGCLTRTVLNRFCYGQCNSFYIPKNPPKKKRNRKRLGEEEADESASFRSCGFCRPKRASSIVVTLRCPSVVPHFKKKRVLRIKQCKCLAENVSP